MSGTGTLPNVCNEQPHRLRYLGWDDTTATTTIQKELMVSDNQSIFYEAWISDLQRDLDSLREDKRELLRKVAQLEELVAEYGNKLTNLIQQRGDE